MSLESLMSIGSGSWEASRINVFDGTYELVPQSSNCERGTFEQHGGETISPTWAS